MATGGVISLPPLKQETSVFNEACWLFLFSLPRWSLSSQRCAAGFRQHITRKRITAGSDMPDSPRCVRREGMYMDTTENVIYLAGGCFWGMEQLMHIPGVIDAQSGYANGYLRGGRHLPNRLQRRHRLPETVRVEYDPEQVSLGCPAAGLLLRHRPHGAEPAGATTGAASTRPACTTPTTKPEWWKRIAELIERAAVRNFSWRSACSRTIIPSRGVPPELPEKEPHRLLPHPPGGDGAVLQASNRSGRPEARGGELSGTR